VLSLEPKSSSLFCRLSAVINLFLASCAAIRRNYPKLLAFSIGVKNNQIVLSELEIL